MTGDIPGLSYSWWIRVVEIPVLAGLFWLFWRGRRDTERQCAELRTVTNQETVELRERLAAFKLDVAKSYASIDYLKDVEQRLTEHLLRIEAKLDRDSHGSKAGSAGG